MKCKNKMGTQTVNISNSVKIISSATVAGTKEQQGKLKGNFDILMDDGYFGEKTWEKAESKMQREAAKCAVQKAGLSLTDIDIAFSGDLLNQCTGTGYGMRELQVPFYGLFGACSTMALSMSLGAMIIDGGFAKYTLCGTSSHFCSSEKQFRMPLAYGGQRPPTAQRTVTGSGMVVLSDDGNGPEVTQITTGKIIDKGIKDPANMGAAMAPAAFDTLKTHFKDTNKKPQDYDLIVTGDLGELGYEIVCDYMEKEGYDISNYNDCGRMIFEESQDTHAGGSGCGCSALVLCASLLKKLKKGELNKILFVGTGALMSPLSTQQGESIPSIAHAVVISNKEVTK